MGVSLTLNMPVLLSGTWWKSSGKLLILIGRVFSDMKFRFLNSQEDELIPRVTLYSGHSTALALTLTTLGIFHDEVPLLHDNYEEQRGRQFISSYQITNAGNMEFVLFYCHEGVANRHFKFSNSKKH